MRLRWLKAWPDGEPLVLAGDAGIVGDRRGGGHASFGAAAEPADSAGPRRAGRFRSFIHNHGVAGGNARRLGERRA